MKTIMVLVYTDTNSLIQADTLVGDEFEDSGGGIPRQPALTILYHPDLRRVGERALLASLASGGEEQVSRLSPCFAVPGKPGERSLRDPYLSRRPVRVRMAGERVELQADADTMLRVNGRQVDDQIRLHARALDEGVVIEIAQRVVLLLHRVRCWGVCPRSWELVGESDPMIELRRHIARVADLDVSVLIRGETGVGKERVAQAIHAASRRAGRPLVAVNMAALATGTAASELFGHEKGAFTGASSRHLGLFARAHGSTLFLDEIGETPESIQTMLLRTLAERAIRPVGAHADVPVDVRLVAATDADLERARDAGSFRAALLYRLSGYEIQVPPLRERREDIPRLVVHFLGEMLGELGETWRLQPLPAERRLWFPPALMSRLYEHAWPGNVRQLRNAVRQLVIANRGAESIRPDAGVERLLEDHGPAPGAPASARRVHRQAMALRSQRRSFGHDTLIEALRACDWSVPRAAKRLGVPRATLYSRIERIPEIRKATDLSHADILACMRDVGNDLEAIADRLCVSKRGLKLRMKALGMGC